MDLRIRPEIKSDYSRITEINDLAFRQNAGDIRHETLALAPVSVLPDYQNKGIGSRLVKEGLKSAKGLGYNSVIVLGHPGYYPRFGFECAGKWDIKAPFDVPDDVFLAIELKKDSLRNTCGIVEYPKEFIGV